MLYTIGGVDNLLTARAYYSMAIAYQTKNVGALYGLMQCCRTLEKLKKNDDKNKQLLEVISNIL